MGEHAAEKYAAPHGQIKTVDHAGYAVYVCADCGQNINSPTCYARRSTQPNPPTFESLLNDPTQQLDPEGIVAATVFPPDWLAQVKATARAEAWDEGWSAGSRWQRDEEAAKRSFGPMPALPPNPYREIGGAS